MKVEALSPHGFCAGVANALRRARELLQGARRVYCLHELVHNELVIADLRAQGMVFVEDLADVPPGATVLFSAHGVSPAVRAVAAARNLRTVDATCPFVARVHAAARAFAAKGLPVVVIGNPAHAEVRGIVGEVTGAHVLNPSDPHAAEGLPPRFGLVSQTTMDADGVAALAASLRAQHAVETMAEVCRATQERQDAVKAFEGDALLVLGSANSSNTRRLCEVARCRTFRAGTLEEVKALDLSGAEKLGVTSGASTPEDFFKAVIRELEVR